MINKYGKTLILLLFYSFSLYAQDCSNWDKSYYYGRQYYVLRSGKAKMIIQSDKADNGSAFTFMVFDAEKTQSSSRKNGAVNYRKDECFSSSALKAVIRGIYFQAYGTTTKTEWVTEDGIPSVEAIWWAGGFRIKEVITPVSSNGLFRRLIEVESKDMVGNDTLSLQLDLPSEIARIGNNIFACYDPRGDMAIITQDDDRTEIHRGNKGILLGPVALKPGEKKIFVTFLYISMPGNNPGSLAQQCSTPDELINVELARVREQWKRSNRISTSDRIVQRMYDNCRYTLPAYVSDAGNMDGGIFEYGAQWVRDASNTALGLIHTGEFELARAMLGYMIENMITDNGTTMISGGFDEPDREQFDQMGEFIFAMKNYVDWTGDTSLLVQHAPKIVKMIDRPLNPAFRDSTGMVHNRREFWERTFSDAYELAYQTWVIKGLQCAADMAVWLNASEKAKIWLREAEIIKYAMLHHPQMKLVDNGHLIKRRNITGKIADTVRFEGWVYGAPAQTEYTHRLMPDATMALPIAMELIDPASNLSVNTLAELEKLWNRRWYFGGYDRYNTSSQGDQPGPWPFATTFIMRAQHEAGQLEKSRRSLQWLDSIPGGNTGALFEEIPIISAQAQTAGLIPWTSAELTYFFVHYFLGMRFVNGEMIIKPNIYSHSSPVTADIRFRNNRITLDISGYGKPRYAIINGIKVKGDTDGLLHVPRDFQGGSIRIVCK